MSPKETRSVGAVLTKTVCKSLHNQYPNNESRDQRIDQLRAYIATNNQLAAATVKDFNKQFMEKKDLMQKIEHEFENYYELEEGYRISLERSLKLMEEQVEKEREILEGIDMDNTSAKNEIQLLISACLNEDPCSHHGLWDPKENYGGFSSTIRDPPIPGKTWFFMPVGPWDT